MTESASRLSLVRHHFKQNGRGTPGTMNSTPLPKFDELPTFEDMPGCAWTVWGKDDQLGTVNLLTPDVVARAAKEEIKTGRTTSLNWPINFPAHPFFGRKAPEDKIVVKYNGLTHDDELHINTQSGSQWDGLRHFSIIKHGVYYNNHRPEALQAPTQSMPDPLNVDYEALKLGIHNWAQHGICGRGVLLDMEHWYTKKDGKLPYDPWTTYGFSVAELEACAKDEGIQFRTGDILVIRTGFIKRYYASSPQEKDQASEHFAGIEQSDDMKRFLWNNHFAAACGDCPTLESWPTKEGVPHMHQTILGLWGMPIGEIFDCEGLSKLCQEQNRWTFFFSSWPLNVLGGIASPPNAAAYF